MIRFFYILLFLLPSVSFSAPFSLQLHDVRLVELLNVVYGDLRPTSFVVDSDVLRMEDTVSVDWLKLSDSEVRALTVEIMRMRGVELKRVGNIVYAVKRSTDDESVLLYLPRNRSARYLSDMVTRLIQVQPLGNRGMPASVQQQQSIQKQPEVQGSASSVIDRSASDQIAFPCAVTGCARLRAILEQLDTPEAQVVLRAALYEVGTTAGEGGAVKLAGKLLSGVVSAQAGATLTGGASLHIAASNFDAVLAVLDNDSRFHVLSRPMLRVKTGSSARFSVGSQVPVLGSVSYDAQGRPIQAVDYKPSGTILTVQPDVRKDLIDLNITQELSSFVATTNGVNNSPTMLQRTANSQLTVKDGEVVVFAGLEEVRDDESKSSLFGWQLSGTKNKTTSEVLLLIEAQRI